MATFNEELLDAIIRHQVGLLRYSGSVRNRIWRALDATEGELRRLLEDRLEGVGLDSPARLARLQRLLELLRETRLKGWKEARAAWFEEAHALAQAEPGFLDRTISSVFPVELGALLPDPAYLRDLVTSTPFKGKTLRQWADKIQREDLDRIEATIRDGVLRGEGPRQIARRVVGTVSLKGSNGVTQITRRGAEAITRTVLNGIGAEARRAYLEANSDLAPRELFVATLDSRTTPICRSLDGNVYEVGKGPRLPLHFGERSLYAPQLDGEVVGERPRRDFTQRQLLREYAAQEGFARPPLTRGALPRGHKAAFDAFARARMRELTGTTAARTTYAQWLGRQSAAFQDDLLGPTRGALFRRGSLTLDKFVLMDGRELSLAELSRRYEEAFLAAHLDPSDFR